jgi:ankyrin repeat protein
VFCFVVRAQEGNTPLHNAAENGDASVIAALCERGADKEAKNNVRCTRPPAHTPQR